MKIKLGLMLLLLWLVPTFTLAEGGIVLDEAAVFGDMPCSWAQGYEPSVSGNTLLVHVPLAAVNSLAGSVKIELFADNAAISPFKLEGTYTTAYINEAGSCSATLKVPLVKGRINGDYPCKLVFTAKASDGTRGIPFCAAHP